MDQLLLPRPIRGRHTRPPLQQQQRKRKRKRRTSNEKEVLPLKIQHQSSEDNLHASAKQNTLSCASINSSKFAINILSAPPTFNKTQSSNSRRFKRRKSNCKRINQQQNLNLLTNTLSSILCNVKPIKKSSTMRINFFCIGEFGFIANKDKKIWQYIRQTIGDMPLNEHHSHSSNMKCHNLCTTAQPPTNMEKLLVLGIKLFLQKSMMSRFNFDARVKCYVKHSLGERTHPMPKLCINARNPNLPKAPSTIEESFLRF